MASINNLEMAETIANNSNIKISKGFLGIGSKATYTPTNSKLNAVINYYSAEDAQAYVKLINAAETEIASLAKKVTPPAKLSISNYRLEACVTDDKQFVAIQVLSYADFRNTPICDVKYFEGEAAQAIAAML
ncbi:hypothetical protein LK429_04090 [Hoylesella buccalis]|uniref:hypothetical protein n=1 Tax=Hoylesella buccalis TaxID=28127 RepID=UPI001D097A01|nr:hypothetical protein [Hoylesella buccalis]MBS5613339.1 hypothetical protein [Hoylesella buccalis]MCB6901717.1 hypothetical protein [Hoylesella buccalis]UEA63753.1 hypothetical protein LK429_04090 [Hoylesella buccalis]UWP48954.1 hypothetical protein NQ518_10540 [Hoylesella buccalis ATCC 35310]